MRGFAKACWIHSQTQQKKLSEGEASPRTPVAMEPKSPSETLKARMAALATRMLASRLRNRSWSAWDQPLFNEELEGCAALYGADHQATKTSARNLMALYSEQGDADMAAKLGLPAWPT